MNWLDFNKYNFKNYIFDASEHKADYISLGSCTCYLCEETAFTKNVETTVGEFYPKINGSHTIQTTSSADAGTFYVYENESLINTFSHSNTNPPIVNLSAFCKYKITFKYTGRLNSFTTKVYLGSWLHKPIDEFISKI